MSKQRPLDMNEKSNLPESSSSSSASMDYVMIHRLPSWIRLMEYLFEFGPMIKLVVDKSKSCVTAQVIDPYSEIVIQAAYRAVSIPASSSNTVLYVHAPSMISFLNSTPLDQQSTTFIRLSWVENTQHPLSFHVSTWQTKESSAEQRSEMMMQSRAVHDYVDIDNEGDNKSETFSVRCFILSELQNILMRMLFYGTDMRVSTSLKTNTECSVHLFTKSDMGVLGYEWLARVVSRDQMDTESKQQHQINTSNTTKKNGPFLRKLHERREYIAHVCFDKGVPLAVSKQSSDVPLAVSKQSSDVPLAVSKQTKESQLVPLRACKMILAWPFSFPPKMVEFAFSDQRAIEINMPFEDYNVRALLCPSSSSDGSRWINTSSAINKYYFSNKQQPQSFLKQSESILS